MDGLTLFKILVSVVQNVDFQTEIHCKSITGQWTPLPVSFLVKRDDILLHYTSTSVQTSIYWCIYTGQSPDIEGAWLHRPRGLLTLHIPAMRTTAKPIWLLRNKSNCRVYLCKHRSKTILNHKSAIHTLFAIPIYNI